MAKRTTVAYADGACKGNPGKGGYGSTLSVMNGKYTIELLGYSSNTTNNIMEMSAVLAVLEAYKPNTSYEESLLIKTDSKYVIQAISTWIANWKSKGWRKADKKPVLNVDLWKKIDARLSELKQVGVTVTLEWIKGHSGELGNEIVDGLANKAVYLSAEDCLTEAFLYKTEAEATDDPIMKRVLMLSYDQYMKLYDCKLEED